MYCLIVLCLVSNIYQLLHTSANIKHCYNFEHLSFWGYFLAASSFSAWSSWYWSLVLSFSLAFKDELHSSAWGGLLTQHLGLVQRWVQAPCWPSDDGLFAMPWFSTWQRHKGEAVAFTMRLVTHTCVSTFPLTEWHHAWHQQAPG